MLPKNFEKIKNNACILQLFVILYSGSKNLGVAQFGSALPWGGRGRGFNSRHSDQVVAVVFHRGDFYFM